MQKIPVKKWIAYPVAVVFFLILSYGFVPQVFQGKTLNQERYNGLAGNVQRGKRL
jgi:hypothetical protein